MGAAVKTSSDSNSPVFVSVGSGLSLKTGIKIVNQVSRYRPNGSYTFINSNIRFMDGVIELGTGYQNQLDRQT